jgi:hypothetical protein
MILQLHNLHWLAEDAPERDLCAHGAVTVQIGETLLATPDDGDWCVSAASIYLLRTLTTTHTYDAPVGEQLMPCCGFAMYPQDNSADVFIMGCSSGVDWEVHHEGDRVRLRTYQGEEEMLSLEEWRRIVAAFADAVASFYAASAPKQFSDSYDAQGFAAFQAEWARRRNT